MTTNIPLVLRSRLRPRSNRRPRRRIPTASSIGSRRPHRCSIIEHAPPLRSVSSGARGNRIDIDDHTTACRDRVSVDRPVRDPFAMTPCCRGRAQIHWGAGQPRRNRNDGPPPAPRRTRFFRRSLPAHLLSARIEARHIDHINEYDYAVFSRAVVFGWARQTHVFGRVYPSRPVKESGNHAIGPTATAKDIQCMGVPLPVAFTRSNRIVTFAIGSHCRFPLLGEADMSDVCRIRSFRHPEPAWSSTAMIAIRRMPVRRPPAHETPAQCASAIFARLERARCPTAVASIDRRSDVEIQTWEGTGAYPGGHVRGAT